MQQKDMVVGDEVAIRRQGRLVRVKVLRLRVKGSYSARAESVAIEYRDKPREGERAIIAARDIDMTWEAAEPIQAERDRKEIERADLERDGAQRVQQLADKIKTLTGSDPMIAMHHGREIGRTPANKVLRQVPGERITLDTDAVEELIAQLEVNA